jgi:hypothetical protein
MGIRKKACCAACAKLTLTCTHTHSCASSEVNEVMYVQLIYSIFNLTYRNLFTLADETCLVLILEVDKVRSVTVASYSSLVRRTWLGPGLL